MKAKWTAVLVLSWAGLAVPLPALAQNGDVAVVVNQNLSVSNLTVADLRKVFAGEKRSWAGGLPVKLIVRAPGTHERDALLKLLGMSESEYQQYWTSQILRGEALTEPLILPSFGIEKEVVALYPGAIALVEARDVKSRMKVVKVNNRLPGETGYPLR